jgi:ATP-binding protein involved in chromosome partitioning
MVMKAVDQLLAGVRWGQKDFLQVDLPPGTGDVQLTLTQRIALSGAIIVTTPQDVALIDARKGLNMFRKMGVPVLGIIENMSHYVCPDCGREERIFKRGGGRQTAETLEVPFLGEIPIDPKIVIGGDSGKPIVALEPESPAARTYLAVAETIARALRA